MAKQDLQKTHILDFLAEQELRAAVGRALDLKRSLIPDSLPEQVLQKNHILDFLAEQELRAVVGRALNPKRGSIPDSLPEQDVVKKTPI